MSEPDHASDAADACPTDNSAARTARIAESRELAVILANVAGGDLRIHSGDTWDPSTWPAEPSALRLAMTFTRPSVSPTIWARLLNLNGCFATTTSWPPARACSSSGPAQATSGWQ